jgi:hypothetical protein
MLKFVKVNQSEYQDLKFIMEEEKIAVSKDCVPVLLILMGDLSLAPTARVIEEFGILFGNRISKELFEENSSGRIKWAHAVHWARHSLKKAGLMGSGGRGIWTITDAGRQWLEKYPDGGKRQLLALIQTHDDSNKKDGGFYWKGDFFRVNKEEVLIKANELLANKKPDEAFRFNNWYILIKKERVSVKWIFHLITDSNYNDFTTYEARSRLKRIGILAINTRNTPSSGERNAIENPPLSFLNLIERDRFFENVGNFISKNLITPFSGGQIKHYPGKNYMVLNYLEFPRSHYELRLARAFHEVAFHLEGRKEDNIERLSLIKPFSEKFSQLFGHRVEAKIWGSRWARLTFEFPKTYHNEIRKNILNNRGSLEGIPEYIVGMMDEDINGVHSENLIIAIYGSLMVKFVDATFTSLCNVFDIGGGSTRRANIRNKRNDNEVHDRVNEIIQQIKNFLLGFTSKRPSDEQLSDWVFLCYTLGLYKEGYEIFNIIDSTNIDSWQYKRIKKFAKVCKNKMDNR